MQETSSEYLEQGQRVKVTGAERGLYKHNQVHTFVGSAPLIERHF